MHFAHAHITWSLTFILFFIPGMIFIDIIFCNIHYSKGNGKGKEVPVLAWIGPEDSGKLRLPEFLDIWHLKMPGLSALCTGCLYPPGDSSDTHFCWRLSQPKGCSGAWRIKSTKIPNDCIRNQNHDLVGCRAVPQPTVCHCIPHCPLQNIEK